MGEEQSRYAEVIVRIAPSRDQTRGESAASAPLAADKLRTRSYDAFIYTDLELSGLQSPSGFSPYESKEIRGLPLRGVEQVVVCWEVYREYRASFILGEKAAYGKLWERLTGTGEGEGDAAALKNLRSNLFGRPSAGLESLLRGGAAGERPLRIWWSSAVPDLVELPWELMAYEGRQQAGGKFSFVRGLPPRAPVPRIPVGGALRLAFIDSGVRTPDALHAALKDLPGVAVTRMVEPPRSALRKAIREGFELIHMVADGSVSHSYEGVLYLSSSETRSEYLHPLVRRMLRIVLSAPVPLKRVLGQKLVNRVNDYIYAKLDIETCSAGELRALFNGSRVAVLSLTAPKTADDDPNRLDGILLPSVYRVFATLGNSPLPLPNIVAPLGPLTDGQLTRFWREFYTRLAEPTSYSLEEAVGHAQEAGGLTVPVALFLRQRLGREFARLTPEQPAPAKEPTLLNSELQAARELVEQLRAIDSKYEGLADEIGDTEIIAREQTRQSQLEQELSRWTRLEKGEQ